MANRLGVRKPEMILSQKAKERMYKEWKLRDAQDRWDTEKWVKLRVYNNVDPLPFILFYFSSVHKNHLQLTFSQTEALVTMGVLKKGNNLVYCTHTHTHSPPSADLHLLFRRL